MFVLMEGSLGVYMKEENPYYVCQSWEICLISMCVQKTRMFGKAWNICDRLMAPGKENHKSWSPLTLTFFYFHILYAFLNKICT